MSRAHSSPPRLASLIRERRQAIIDAWVAVERGRYEGGPPVNRKDLVDSMPRMLDELATHLETHGEDARHDRATFETAVIHGVQRVQVGLPLDFLIEEYAILRRVMTRIFAAEAEPPAEEDLEQFHALLDLAIRSAAAAHTQAQVDSRDRIVGIVSHDLRDPLNAIVLGAQTLLEQNGNGMNPVAARALARILSSSDRAQRMISDLLDYSNAAAGSGLRIRPQPTDLALVIDDVLEELRSGAPHRTIALEIDTRPVEGTWDPDRIAQVIANLVRNALQYSLANTVVTVRVQGAMAEEARFEVHNEGPAIAPAQLPALFEPFQRGRGAGTVAGNVGLGLFIAHEVVRAHGGSIDVHSTAAEGTTFSVRLPRVPPETPDG